MDDDMQKNYEYSGTFTTLQEEETTDIFYDITNVLMKGFTYEFQDKPNIDFLISMRNQTFVVTTSLRAVFSVKMIYCEKILCETLFDKKKAMKTYGIDEEEWEAIIAYDPSLAIKEPMKRVYRYKLKLTIPEGVNAEFLETGLELLKNIQ